MIDSTLFTPSDVSMEVCGPFAVATNYCFNLVSAKRRVCWILPNDPGIFRTLSSCCCSDTPDKKRLVRYATNHCETLWSVEHAAKHGFDATIVMLPLNQDGMQARAIKHLELLMRASPMQLIVIRPIQAAGLSSPIPTRVALMFQNGQLSQLLFKLSGVPVHSFLDGFAPQDQGNIGSFPHLTKTVNRLNQYVSAWLNSTTQYIRNSVH